MTLPPEIDAEFKTFLATHLHPVTKEIVADLISGKLDPDRDDLQEYLYHKAAALLPHLSQPTILFLATEYLARMMFDRSKEQVQEALNTDLMTQLLTQILQVPGDKPSGPGFDLGKQGRG